MKLNKQKIYVLLLAFMMLAAILTGCGLSTDNNIKSNSSGSEDIPSEIPDFSLKDMQGSTVTQVIFGENKLTLVNVWATTCAPCMDELPDLESLNQAYGMKGVGFLGIIADGKYCAPQAKELIQELGISYPNLVPDDNFMDVFLSKQDAVPYTMLVDDTGKVLEFVMGSQSKDTFQKLIDDHLD